MLDVVIRNAHIIDGTGTPGWTGEIGLEGDKIAALGVVDCKGRREIDAGGQVVCPGFIDIHTHSDFSLLIDGRAQSAVYHGVTTQINGNCGVSAFPSGEMGPYLGPFETERLRSILEPRWDSAAGYFSVLEAQGIAINSAFFTGHGALRQAVMGVAARAPSKAEMEVMKQELERQMIEGSLGLSTGLTYMPGSCADIEEITELVAVTAPYGGIYATHMRNYTAAIFEALEEAITIGRRAGVPVHISHITPCPPATGSAGKLLQRLAQAQQAGEDVTAETEFYATGSTSLKSLLPPWALEGGNALMVERLCQDSLRQKMWQQILESGSELGGSTKTVLMQYGQWEKLWLGNCLVNQDSTGKSFAEIGRQRQCPPFEAICDILVEEEGAASFYGEDKTNEDIEELGRGEYCGFGSDGLALAKDGPLAHEREHPRCYGGMAYLLRTLVRERKSLDLEQMIHKITLFPARRMGLGNRGLLRPGLQADLLVFDSEKIADRATINDPCLYSEGIQWSFVNGEAVLQNGCSTGVRPGRILRAPAGGTTSNECS